VTDGNSKWAVSHGFDWSQFTSIPEPETWTVLGSGLCTAACLLRKKIV
jgi:hypothetical protein